MYCLFNSELDYRTLPGTSPVNTSMSLEEKIVDWQWSLKPDQKFWQQMSRGYMYILKCADGSYYTGSTKDLEKRIREHQNMYGANYTKRRLPVILVYYEEYDRIDEAFYREKQIQGWSHKKKKALIEGNTADLKLLAKKVFARDGHLDKIPSESLDDRKKESA